MIPLLLKIELRCRSSDSSVAPSPLILRRSLQDATTNATTVADAPTAIHPLARADQGLVVQEQTVAADSLLVDASHVLATVSGVATDAQRSDYLSSYLLKAAVLQA